MAPDYSENTLDYPEQTITVKVLPCVITDFSTTGGTPIPETSYVIEGPKIDIPIQAFVQTPNCVYTQTYTLVNINGGAIPAFITLTGDVISYQSN